MKKKIKEIYYSDELPDLIENILICSYYGDKNLIHTFGLCELIDNSNFDKYYDDWGFGYISEPGIWSSERLNLICLLIHSLKLEDK